MDNSYLELHCHTNYSFQEGASTISELLNRAKQIGYIGLGLTDHDNLCAAMEFAELAKIFDLKSIIGAEISLEGGTHITLLASNKKGYSNLCKLISLQYFKKEKDEPELSKNHFYQYSDGLLLLTGCNNSELTKLFFANQINSMHKTLKEYLDVFGEDNVFIELQNHFVKGDIQRNKKLIELAGNFNLLAVATNNVHYHLPERQKIQDVLIAAKNNLSLNNTHLKRKSNAHYYLKNATQMNELFSEYPSAVSNSLKVAELCEFDLTKKLGYNLPSYSVPKGYNAKSFLKEICLEAAYRKYGELNSKIMNRLEEELDLIEKNKLEGFFLLYRDVIEMAHQIMVEINLSNPEISLEERPPGRGRGSSVSMLVGYLIGISHIDPIKFDLSLERFITDDMSNSLPDIDIDFPREIREQLIKRLHEKWGPEHAVLTGMIVTYKMKSAIRDVAKAFGISSNKILDSSKPISNVRETDNNFFNIAKQICGYPKYLAQHPGGMILSSSPITNYVPIQPSAIKGRFICQWDKYSIDSAGFAKIDLLSLGTLSQMHETLDLIEKREGYYIDLSRIDVEDKYVYDSLHRGDTIGVFQIESAAQIQTIKRIKPMNLNDMAYEVGAVRPGVGVNAGVAQFIARRNKVINWDYDHELEIRSLKKTLGVLLFQDQINQLAIDVGGFKPFEANKLRIALQKSNNKDLITKLREQFIIGALNNNVSKNIAVKIFDKFNGNYMFPEAHAFAFGVTAYHMAWLKYYYPKEFFTAIFNQQPMGFYNLETLKEDAKRHGIKFLHPDVNLSSIKCKIVEVENIESIILGLINVKGIGYENASNIISAREVFGSFKSISDLSNKTHLSRLLLENLAIAGALDNIVENRREAIWEIGAYFKDRNNSNHFPTMFKAELPKLEKFSKWEIMSGEYRSMGVYIKGHIMKEVREKINFRLFASNEVDKMEDGSKVVIAGLVIRRQKPLAKSIFMTIEDEFGHIPIIVWDSVYEKYVNILSFPLIMIEGIISRREGTFNVVLIKAKEIKVNVDLSKSAHNWH
tara:strand:+ start:1581 stop:4679 length:3099 start_codon:yes stop_codon:yes gene_type:complete